jgi:serine/threonine protein kinase
MSMLHLKHALPSGTMLHQYRLIKTLGGGGFSIVYLAIDTQRDRRVVIKEYLPSDQATRLADETVESISAETSSTFRQGMRRFFDEAAVLAKVDHPNIVRVRDFFRENNTVYLVMDYAEGTDLRWYIKRYKGKLSEKFIRTIFPQLLLGLQQLHKMNLLHLDIKPANIFLRPGGKPMLLDFGAAQQPYANNKLIGAHTMTLGFAPIEQHQRGHIGPWTDIYAIGASMWACMSGRAPPPAIKRAEKDKYKPAVRSFTRRYTRQLLEAVDWCLQMNQLERPQSAQELLEFINQIPEIEENLEDDGIFSRFSLKLPWEKDKTET